MAKKWAQMTQAEKDAAIQLNNLLHDNQDAVRAHEAAVDALASYLKGAKRKRPAPTMLFQYPGLDMRELRTLMVDVEAKHVEAKRTGDAIYRRNRQEGIVA